jgi:hypothetical protein
MRNLILACLVAVPACTVGDDAVSDTELHATKSLCPADVPAELTPAADQDLAFVLDATGVQKYACVGGAWQFIAPEAQLFQQSSQTAVGLHFAGPTWEYQDGSSVVAKKVAGATVDASSIPWLLLVSTSHAGGDGRMSEITAIQRLETAGGLAPASACASGDTLDVPYTTSYFFYRTKTDALKSNVRCGN